MARNIKISVIIPVYNSEKFLKRCVESVLGQSFTDYELILIDDGSLDESGKICDQFKDIDNRVRVYHQGNKGQAAARNFGVMHSVGEWICFVDSDDAIANNMLDTLYSAACRNEKSISLCGMVEGYTIPDDFANVNVEFERFQEVEATEETLKRFVVENNFHYFCVWGALIPSSIVKKRPFDEGHVFEDSAIQLKWLTDANKMLITESKLYFYQINEQGTTKSGFSPKKVDELWSQKKQIDFCLEMGYFDLASLLGKKYMQKGAVIYKAALASQKYDKIAFEVKKNTTCFYLHNKKRLNLTFSENRYIFELFYPNFMRFYWHIVAIIAKIHKRVK